MKNRILLLLNLAAVLIFPLISIAAINAPETVAGTVVAVNDNQITIVQNQGQLQDIGAQNRARQGQQMKEIKIRIGDETEFETIQSANELTQGDFVRVEYTEDGNDRLANRIAKVEGLLPNPADKNYKSNELDKADRLDQTNQSDRFERSERLDHNSDRNSRY